MKPPAFDYVRPTTLSEALRALTTHDDAKVLAGGQSLIPMMNMRLAHPATLVDLNGLSELMGIHEDGNRLVVGSLVRHFQLEQDPRVNRFAPIVAEAERLIAHPAIRTRGTIGGSLAHADPAAELPVLATLFDWEMTVASEDETRTIVAGEFFLSYFMTAMAPNEIVTAVTFTEATRMASSIREYHIRSGDFALAIAAAAMSLDPAGRITSLRLALGGVGDIPWRNPDLEQSVVGELAAHQLWTHLAREASQSIDPPDDLNATAAYRRQLARTLLIQALEDAHGQSLETGGNS